MPTVRRVADCANSQAVPLTEGLGACGLTECAPPRAEGQPIGAFVIRRPRHAVAESLDQRKLQ